ncbi:MAG: 23S rRNA (pseudouridine(1915)-N(3))-methyltransferase RlmH [Methanolinea sp.]|nr:23S rRNA (pseudouridine(1915)-N(3))-methyltransferase RlmH [Methanolinea sp.]
MQVRVIGVGRVRENYIREGIRDYCTRIMPYMRVELRDIPDERIPERIGEREREDLLAREGARILAATEGAAIRIVCAVDGEPWSSEELAARLKKWELSGQSRVAFVVGGPLGIGSPVLSAATHVLSLSRMTFPHQLARLILLEQIFRACRINSGEAYHK